MMKTDGIVSKRKPSFHILTIIDLKCLHFPLFNISPFRLRSHCSALHRLSIQSGVNKIMKKSQLKPNILNIEVLDNDDSPSNVSTSAVHEGYNKVFFVKKNNSFK